MRFLKDIEEMLNSGDAEVRSWFLIKQNYLPFILCSSYALFSWKIGPALMKNRKPFDLRKPMIVFNFLVVAAYVASLMTIFLNLPKISRKIFCKGGSHVGKSGLIYKLVSATWVLYILKYVELLDTVFFILRKKNHLITFLHVMHHTVVPILGWILFRTEQSGFQSIPVLVNSFVHVIMYTYYGLAAMGPRVRKFLWWKKYLTLLQIVQFLFIIIFITVVVPLSGCQVRETTYLIDIIFGPVFLYMFVSFYKSTFSTGETKDVSKST